MGGGGFRRPLPHTAVLVGWCRGNSPGRKCSPETWLLCDLGQDTHTSRGSPGGAGAVLGTPKLGSHVPDSGRGLGGSAGVGGLPRKESWAEGGHQRLGGIWWLQAPSQAAKSSCRHLTYPVVMPVQRWPGALAGNPVFLWKQWQKPGGGCRWPPTSWREGWDLR